MMQMPMGQYRPGNTFFHRADAKGKLLGLCLVIAAVIVSKGLIGCIAAAAAALTVSYLAGISLREQIKQQKGMCRFLAVIFLMNAFFYSGEHCIWSWWVFRKNFSDSPRLSFPVYKNGEWQLQVCLQWSRIF